MDPEKKPAPDTIPWDPAQVDEAHKGADPDDPMIGTLIRDKWRVLSRIGAGSFGTVYKVRDEKGGWIEALKILRVDRLMGPEGDATRARFLREARIMKRLGSRSRHIVRLSTYEEDPDQGLIYFLMEHVEGRNLAEVLDAEGPFTVDRTVDVALQVCDALIAAHDSDPPVVHRDLKLQNLMLMTDDDGTERLMVLDFGIAKIAASDTDSRLTTTGAIGTPGYAAPEQIRAEPVDGRTDLFALGVILYNLLTARDPWLGHLAHEPTDQVYRLMAATDRGEVIPIEDAGARVPPTLVKIVTRLLQREPDDRFQSARDLRDALLEFAGISTRDFPAYSTRDRLPPLPQTGPGDTIPERRLAAVWFSDLVGYSSLSATDEGAALALLDTFHATARKVVEAGGGRIVQFIGDAAFAEFSSTERAVRTAITFHQEFEEATEEADTRPQVRTGVHVGDVLMASNGDLFGDGVNVASRIQNEAEPGQVLVSQDVWRQLKQRRDFHFASVGERSLKGLGSPVWLFAAVSPEEADDTSDSAAGPQTDSPMVPPRARQNRFAHIAGVGVAHLTASGLMLFLSTIFMTRYGLPSWVPTAAAVLLGVGLVIVLVTAWLQTRPTWERPVTSHGPWSLDIPDIFRSLRRGRLPELTWGRTVLGGVVAFAVLFIGAGLMSRGGAAAGPLPPAAPVASTGGTLAILPFDVSGGADATLAEGIPDLIAFTAASADVRTVDPQVLRRQLAGTSVASTDDAARVAAARDSRWAVLGQVSGSGSELSLEATLLDVRTRERMGTATASGPPDALASLVADLTTRLLSQTPLDPEESDFTAEPLSPSHEAVMAYVEGEQRLRDADWAGAVGAFGRARDADPEFALALSRLAFARTLASAPQAPVRDADGERALTLVDELPPREALMARGISLLGSRPDDAVEIFEGLARAHPNDPDIWYLLGDALYHLEGPGSDRQRTAFERTIALAGLYEPAQAHLIASALDLGDADRARSLLAELRAADPESVFLAQFEEAVRVASAGSDNTPGTRASDPATSTRPPTNTAAPVEAEAGPSADPQAGARSAYERRAGDVQRARSNLTARDPHPALRDGINAADDLRDAAATAAGQEDFSRAMDLLDRAAAGYAEVSRAVPTLERYESERASLASLRADAQDPTARSEAEGLERDAARALDAGSYDRAVTLMGQARNAWIRAAQAPQTADDPPPPPARPAPAVVANETLQRLAAAIEAEDLASVRAVWVSILPEAAQGMQDLFALAEDLDVTYDVRSVREQGDRVVVEVHTTYHFEANGRDENFEVDQYFELEERNGTWVVASSR